MTLALVLLLPALLGGCPEFRNATVGSINTATQSVVISDIEQQAAVDTATTGVLSAAFDLFFEQFLNERVR
ncbi:MAG: hypothetical protein GY778_28485 [bacterium]|nr:hypothetical protein [bacterium]